MIKSLSPINCSVHRRFVLSFFSLIGAFFFVSAQDISTATFVQKKDIFTDIPNPSGIALNPDGTKIYVSGTSFLNEGVIYTYDLSTAYDISTATRNTSETFVTDESGVFSLTATDLTFSADGGTLFLVGSYFSFSTFESADSLYSFSLSTPFDVSSAVLANRVKQNISTQEIFTTGIEINDDGSKLFVLGKTFDDAVVDVLEYDLGTANDLSTASAGNTFSVKTEMTYPQSMRFNSDGTKLYVLETDNVGSSSNIFVYDLTTPYDISGGSMSYSGGTEDFDPDFSVVQPLAMALSTDYSKLYLAGTDASGAPIREYDLVTADIDPPVFTSAGTESYAENGTGVVYSAVATDAGTITYSLTGIEDDALFSINGSTGEVSFISSPDFETPADNGGDNTYNIEVTATDEESNNASLPIVITVTDENDNTPVITGSQTFSITENAANGDGVGTVSATDADAGTTFNNWMITAGNDDNVFAIDASSGAITVADNTALDFETTPNYTLTLTVSDGVNTSAGETVAISVNDVNDAPVFTSTPVTSVDEDEFYVYGVTATDPDGDNVVISETVVPDWLSIVEETPIVNTVAYDQSVGFSDVVVDSDGNLFATDDNNHNIVKITPDGDIITFAGSGAAGDSDGTGTAASFDAPDGIVIDADNNLYVSDKNNHKIKKITPSGVVSTFAGSGTSGSSDDETGTNATFNSPGGLAIDASGNLFVVDANIRIRQISPSGAVTTYLSSDHFSSLQLSILALLDVAVDASGNLYITNGGGPVGDNYILKVDNTLTPSILAGSGEAGGEDGAADVASFTYMFDIAVDDQGNILVADLFNYKIRQVTPSGVVSTLAGNGNQTDGDGNVVDGIGSEATFKGPNGVALDASGNIYVAGGTESSIRKITNTSFALFGDASGQVGDHDVTLTASDGNGGTATQTFTITVNDVIGPVATITSGETSPTNASPFQISIAFDEAPQAFAATDLTVLGASASNLQTVSTLEYTVDITPDMDGEILVALQPGVVQDALGNDNPVSNIFQITFDGSAPTVTFYGPENNDPPPTVVNDVFYLEIEFSEEVSGIDANNLTITGASALYNFIGVHALEITPNDDLVDGDIITIQAPLGFAQDAAGNDSEASEELSIRYDGAGPVVTDLVYTESPALSPFAVTIQFDEAITLVDETKIVITNGSGSFTVSTSGDALEGTITSSGFSDVIIDVQAGAVQDQFEQLNTETFQETIVLTYDKYSGGTGIETDPYLITIAADIVQLAAFSDDWGASFVQTADIVLTETDEFSPIGNNTVEFSGTYDGGGHTVEVNSTLPGGFFGRTGSTSEIMKLGVIVSQISSGGSDVGTLIDSNKGKISECFAVIGYINTTSKGGLVGLNEETGIIENSYAISDFTNSNIMSVGDGGGALVGSNFGMITNSYGAVKYSDVLGSQDGIAGLTGNNFSSGTVENSFHDGELIGYINERDGSISLSSRQMKSLCLYEAAGWDFVGEEENGTTDIWNISATENNGYPILAWQNPSLSDPICVKYNGGSGTETDPYQIDSKFDLLDLSKSSQDWGMHFIQTNDIVFEASDFDRGGEFGYPHSTLEGYNIHKTFKPIANFSGSYEGGNHTISGLVIENPGEVANGVFIEYIDIVGSNLGLFSTLESGAEVKNLTLSNFELGYATNVGVLAAVISEGATVENVHVSGTVFNSKSMGGITAENGGSISNSSSTVDIYSSAEENTFGAGIAIYNTGSISFSYSNSSFSLKNVSGQYYGTNAGFVANNSGLISNSYARGEIENNSRVPVFVGDNSGQIDNCYGAMEVTVSGFDFDREDPGVFYTRNTGTITNSFFDAELAGNGVPEFGSLSTDLAMNISYINSRYGWEFCDVWKPDSDNINGGYPILAWQSENTDCTIIDVITGADSFSNYAVYPNPSGGIFNLDLTEGISHVEVINMLGQRIFNQSISNETSIKLDLGNRPDGVYFIKLFTDSEVHTKQVILKK